MPRFFVPPSDCREASITLTGREAHHGLHALRLQRGDPATLLDGVGGQCDCEVSGLTRHTIVLNVTARKQIPRLPYRLTLLQAIPKGKIMESIVQKATELGAFRVVPLLTERVVTRLDDEKSTSKAEHWRAIAIESIKQCGSAWLPVIDPPMALADWLSHKETFDLSLLASLQPDSRHPREWFTSLSRGHQPAPRSVAVWVGPEGDFTDAEISAIESTGAHPISLGPLVLRSETAAIYSLSVASYELQQGRA